MAYQPDHDISSRLKDYYQSSERYRDDLCSHDRDFLAPFLILIERYVRKPAHVLDVGCGTGLSTRLLQESGFHAVGADLSPMFLSVEKRENAETNLIAADAFHLPFEDEAFDAVVAFEFIEHIPDIPRLLDELMRVVKVRGYLIFHSPNLLSPYLPAFDLLRMMFGKEGRPVFAETMPQAFRWFVENFWLCWKKKLSLRPHFLYREPDLTENRIGGDADSVFLANPMDIARYLYANGWAIDQRAHAMSIKNKCIAAMTPNFAPYMGLVAHKRAIAKIEKNREQ